MPLTQSHHHRREADLPKCLADIQGLGYNTAAVTTAPLALPPSFFIVGAPRCGTTSLSKTLGHHPQISFSKPKETHFFINPCPEDGEAGWRSQYIDRYHHHLSPDHQALGDGSVSYLYCPEAIERALRFDPRAKFIALVRNPVEMLASYHARMLYQLDEDVADFATAWALQDSRAAGRNLPKRCRDFRLLQYAEVARHGAHVERLFQVAGRERCLVILFEDWIRTPGPVYRRVLDFIGVADDGRTHFARKRETMGFKSRWLQQFVMNPPPWLLRLIASWDMRRLQRLKQLRKQFKRFNNRPAERPALSAEMRRTVREHFAEDVKKLSRLLERDLGHWG